MQPSEKSNKILEPKRKNRVLIVASMLGCYALSFAPDEFVPIAWMSEVLAYAMLIGILANYIYDGDSER